MARISWPVFPKGNVSCVHSSETKRRMSGRRNDHLTSPVISWKHWLCCWTNPTDMMLSVWQIWYLARAATRDAHKWLMSRTVVTRGPALGHWWDDCHWQLKSGVEWPINGSLVVNQVVFWPQITELCSKSSFDLWKWQKLSKIVSLFSALKDSACLQTECNPQTNSSNSSHVFYI